MIDAALDAEWNPALRYYETPKTLLQAFGGNERALRRHIEIALHGGYDIVAERAKEFADARMAMRSAVQQEGQKS